MAAPLQIKFDPNQDFQLEAVESVVRLFEGLPRRSTEFRLGDEVAPNWPMDDDLPEDLLLKNVLAAQARNAIGLRGMQLNLDVDEGLGMLGTDTTRYPSFTVEMETGTGKTYVYLRTLYELRRQYGFGKFIVVVPSIAIYEGVAKNFEITREHFRSLFGNEVVNLVRYDGSQLSRLRGFATSTFAEIMIMTLDSFNKVTNNLYKSSEKLPGERRPYQFIQETRPILVLDEPQNMGREISKTALRTLNPLFALRYSATHRETPNLVYRLTPYQAFERNLVKKIQIAGVTEREDANESFLALESINRRGTITARLRTLVIEKGRTRNGAVTLKQGDDLYAQTGRPEHKGRYRVVEIHAGEGFVEFENGVRLRLDEEMAPDRPRIFQTQIEETVKAHFELQDRLRPQGIKVLSLFFIDRVANYVEDGALIKRLFDQAFNKFKKDYPAFASFKPEQVRQGYFAKKKVKDEEVAIDTEGRTAEQREAEKAAFALIMRDKERLLSFDEPVAFIFAHSALKEGWDNPNVFQICSLNQAVSEIRRRQEIGRGMRLCVNQDGDRVFGDDVNVLTVVANERYSAYADALQQEYQEDDLLAPPAPTDARRKAAARNDRLFKSSPDFRAFWEKLAQKLRYRIELDTRALIEACVGRLNNQTFPEPIIEVTTGDFAPTHYQLKLDRVDGRGAWIQVEITRTDGEKTSATKPLQKLESLADKVKVEDVDLGPFKVVEVSGLGDQAKVIFGNGVQLAVGGTIEFGGRPGRVLRERATIVTDTKYPVFNLIDRAARETGLTRATLVSIFKQMRLDKKALIFRNPEGFAGVFITEIRNAVADQVAETIIFEADLADLKTPDLETLFPKSRSFPQRELRDAGERGLYDLVQTDSAVENGFVALLKDDPKVTLFFKFPAAFKIKLPKLIGNYNPDWGIVRRRDDGTYTVYLVRETKGGELDTLRFPHEKRKVRCAQAYFDGLDIDYRQIDPNTFTGWWQLNSELTQQSKLFKS